MNTKNKIKLIIFDLDNTICDTIGAIPKSMSVCFKFLKNFYPNISFDLFIQREESVFNRLAVEQKIPVYSIRAIYWHEIFKELNIPINPILIKDLILLYSDQLAKNVELFDGITELLDYLKGEKFKMTILSNGDYITKAHMLQYLNILHYFDLVVSSDMILSEKPNPNAFKYVLNHFNIDPQHAIMIGDEIKNDIEGSLQVGIQPIYAKWSHKNLYKDTSQLNSKVIVCTKPIEVIDYLK